MTRIVVASNRGPVTFGDDGSAHRGAGGLASSLGAAMANSENMWIAAAMAPGDRAFAARAPDQARTARTELGDFRLRLVSVPPEDYAAYYDVVANRLIWFALHRLFDPVRRPLLNASSYQAWDRFVGVNEAFAAACVSELEDGDQLLVQDYHLPLVPSLVRRSGKRVRMAHFSHTAWPGVEALSLLPDDWVRQIVSGMLGADGVTFHSRGWARNFEQAACELAGARRVETGLEVDGRHVNVGVCPLGPDPVALEEAAASPQAEEEGKRLDDLLDGRRLILRVERLEPAKNALRGLLAYEILLDERSDLRNDILHVSLSYASRTNVPEYQSYRKEVEAAARHINERHPGSLVLFTDDNYPRSLAALRRYDVLLVNSIADGLNLVAKEGPILNQRHGAVVLSREAGASDGLEGAAWIINPFDTTGTAAAIAAALDAPDDERRRRAADARARSLEDNPSTWLRGQLRALGDGDAQA